LSGALLINNVALGETRQMGMPLVALAALALAVSANVGCNGNAKPPAANVSSGQGSQASGDTATVTGAEPGAVPNPDSVRRQMESFLQQRFSSGEPNDQECFYSTDGKKAYRFRGNSSPKFDISVADAALTRETPKTVQAQYDVNVAASGLMVSSKPKPDSFESLGDGYYKGVYSDSERLFPSLVPWTTGQSIPAAKFRVIYSVNIGEPFFIASDEQAAFYTGLRSLELSELMRLVNQDQSPLLSSLSADARSKYDFLAKAFPRMMPKTSGSYFIFNNSFISPGTFSGVRAGDLGLDLKKTKAHGDYGVVELRGGTHQLWLAEQQPLPEIDRANGITFRARACMVVRGYARSRIVNAISVVGVEPNVKTPWSDWIGPLTISHSFIVMTKSGKTSWEYTGDGHGPSDRIVPDLEAWCLPDEIIKKLVSLVGVSDQPLQEIAD
jgi:hypothetical protein